ncbi:MAG: NAD-dependent epimerase/dehydratase family protein [Candidatus Rokubacteria bacterium]|nr:NAD-dependent epimerase/dehydratase family protein [Candidatus Rokubacteria bacterium]
MEIRGKTALVTGAAGCVGGRLAERLAADEGMRVRALVRDPAKARRLGKTDGIEVVRGDVTRPDSLRPAVAGCQLVFHAAARVGDWGTRTEFYEANVRGTENVLEAALAAGLERFVHISSIAVYGIEAGPGTDEFSPHRPCGDNYIDTKIEAERLAFEYYRGRGLPLTVIQPSSIYGPHAGIWTVRPVELMRTHRMALIGGGRGLCPPVYIDNLVDGIVLATRHDQAVGEAFIITDGLSVTWKEFFGFYARMMGRGSFLSFPKSLAWLAALVVEAGARLTGWRPTFTRTTIRTLTLRSTYDITKARERLGYVPRLSLEEGMRRTEAWLREEGYLPRQAASRK